MLIISAQISVLVSVSPRLCNHFSCHRVFVGFYVLIRVRARVFCEYLRLFRALVLLRRGSAGKLRLPQGDGFGPVCEATPSAVGVWARSSPVPLLSSSSLLAIIISSFPIPPPFVKVIISSSCAVATSLLRRNTRGNYMYRYKRWSLIARHRRL